MVFNRKFLVSALLTTIFIFFLFDTKLGIVNILESASVFPAILFAAFTAFISFRFFYNFTSFKKKDIVIAFIGSFFLSVFYVFGNQLDLTNDIVFNLHVLLSLLIIGAFYFIVISNLLDKTEKINKFDFKYDVKIIDKILSKYTYIWLLMLVLTIPYIIALNPGSLSGDSYAILMQASGGLNLISGHPIFYTLLIKLYYTITNSLGLSMYYTVLLNSIVQALVMSAIYAYTVYTLRKLNCKLYYVVFVLVFYALFPQFPVYSVTLWKDVIYSGMILLYTILLYRAKTEDNFFADNKNLLSLGAVTLGVMLFRTNGVLVVVMSLPFILVILRKQFLKTLAVTIIPLVLYILFITVGFNLLDVEDFRKNEAFSIPYQHIARIYTEEEHLDPEEIEFMKKVFTDDKDIYNPRLSDISRVYKADIDYFENNTDEFFDNWFKLVKKYPVTLLKSFVNNNYGFWYPDVIQWSVCPTIRDNSNFLPIEPQLQTIERKFNRYLGNLGVFFFMHNTVSKRITSVGLLFTIAVMLFLIKISQKNSKASIIFIPSFTLWLGVVLGSPLHVDFRYVFGLYASLPFIMGIVLFKPDDSDSIHIK